MNVKLGDKVRCKITGYEGIVTAITHYLNSTPRIQVRGKVPTDGKYPEPACMDPDDLELIESK